MYPAAEILARFLVLPVDAGAGECLTLWRGAYVRRLGREPEPAMVDSAESVLSQRIEGASPPPLPSSASSTSWHVPRMTLVDWEA